MIHMEIERIVGFIEDVMRESGREKIVIGLSGGIDSAVAVALCSEVFATRKHAVPKSLSEAHVIGVWMPSDSSPDGDRKDVLDLCKKFNIYLAEFPIQGILDILERRMQYHLWPTRDQRLVDIRGSNPVFANMKPRVRMTVLYAFANHYNALVCGTSNKTEYMTGYFTRWGDGVADFEPILHLKKVEVYRMAKDLEVPESIIQKVPSAGLWHGQTDETEMGITYENLDRILDRFELQPYWPNPHSLITKSTMETRVRTMIMRSEFKRKPIPSLLKDDKGDKV